MPPVPRVFKCQWKGCLSLNDFRREADLLRHLKTIHISPAGYPCLLGNCNKVFGRKDHLQQHQRRRHRDALAMECAALTGSTEALEGLV
jgi:hypothetical protein